ncbi:hypothetical protein [Pseudomonas sp. NUPR-001]|uniref:hypothetical protein n=1 Tax=Pseudomonas sp. NUPR-001 TaxID=3416058 RepID=UPI003F9C3B6A
MPQVTAEETFELAKRGLIWRVSHAWEMAAAATFHFGFIIGERDMIALSREYFTMSTALKVELFQATWTGGAPAKTINRRLEFKDLTPPVQWYQGVTPGTLGAAITGFEVESTSSNRVGKDGDKEPFIHTAMTSYVLKVTNTGSGNQPFMFAADFRIKNPQEY